MKLIPPPLPHKHDEVFRKALENPIVAKDFFQAHLPVGIKKILDINSLSLKNCSFIEPDLQKKISDLLFTIQTVSGEGYIYLLLEHQSTSDKWMAFRLFKYMLNICERYKAENPKAKHLPLIYPMVFYNGKQKYNASRNMWNLFQDHELAKKFWTEDYQLVNVREIPDEEMKKRKGCGIMEFFMKHIYERDILSKWEEIAPFLREIEVTIGEGYIDLLLSYTLTSIPSHDKIKLKELLVQNLGKNKGETIVASLAQHWFEEGMYKGFDQGKLEAARNMLKNGLDVELVSKITGMSLSEIKKLR